jgi:hypothetical protein
MIWIQERIDPVDLLVGFGLCQPATQPFLGYDTVSRFEPVTLDKVT